MSLAVALILSQTTYNKSCQKTTMLAGRQPSLNSSQGYSYLKVVETSRSRSQGQKIMVPCGRSCHKEYTCTI